MRAKDLTEDVVDLTDKFKEKQKSNFQDRVARAVAHMPAAFTQQQENEKWMSLELKRVDSLPNRILGKRAQLQLAPLIKQYSPGVSYLDILNFNMDKISGSTPEEVSLARRFTAQHYDQIMDILQQQIEELDRIAAEANTKKWYAPWFRYTNYASTRHNIENLVRNFKEFKHD